MPPHLHPRSRMTSSLFGLTIAASFFVVGLPHVLPCPAPRVRLADSETTADGTRRRRRRKSDATEVKDGIAQFESTTEDFERLAAKDAAKRECPVPKPGGVIGGLMGFNKSRPDNEQSHNNR
ncbi:hypothetical protein JX265_000262 [Neoarthrinium moseri]|uniref:Uncharacterized protein n=1 Tax=Neoarthrinium moseri TaxID=1658444 RepID=A0A9P9WYH3_9PEZI|nr:uncharacterized protein JN550_001038 [Neoarthrinium moseri]KAI1853239.1 hypothetical protein JX266_001945 [Neoarthrinium moseri]KAI1876966.1 hypothetical protein JN550_001038 [Neoarthrinium moseri]KAI1881436.1 hypothetical protein JX265_000262 [Neoarthrinium moseri]